MNQRNGSGIVAASVPQVAIPRASVNPQAPRRRWRDLAREWGRMLILSALTVASFSLIFAPTSWWPLAFGCLVPWALAVLRARRTSVWLGGSAAAGLAFFLLNVRWMYPVTAAGYFALAAYLAAYWPLAAWVLRAARRRGVAATWSLAIVWVACEYLRAWVITGFPWFFIAHAFYQMPLFIQISDLTGAYGVTFAAATVNGLLVDLFYGYREWRRHAHLPDARQRVRRWAAGWLACSLATAFLFGVMLGYGKHQLARQTMVPGPTVALIQEDFPLYSVPPYCEDYRVIFARYLRLAAQSARNKPDLVVFPEVPWQATQNIEFISQKRNAVPGVSAGTWQFGNLSHTAISALATGDYAAVNRVIDTLERSKTGLRLPRLDEEPGPPVTVVVGSLAIETTPGEPYPGVRKYNSALVYDPDGRQRPQRYDKVHLVPFGEVVPFRYGRFHWLYRWLTSLSPFSEGGTAEYSLTPGSTFTVFEARFGGADPLRFATPICYEDVMPYIARAFTWDGRRRRADFLLNISNDGWFLHSAELAQHLAASVFRAVENRVSIARAVNTGISGFIDANGRLYSVVEKDGRRLGRGVVGYSVDRVWIDRRHSVYGALGDWFARLCLVITAVACCDAAAFSFQKWRSRRRAAPA